MRAFLPLRKGPLLQHLAEDAVEYAADDSIGSAFGEPDALGS